MADKKETTETKHHEEDPTQTKKIYEFIKRNVVKTIVSDHNANEVYVIIKNNEHEETINLETGSAMSWLRYSHHKESDKIYSADSYKNALLQLKSDAVCNGSIREKIYNRIAQTDKAIYYDIGDPNWNIIRINKQNYFTVPYSQSLPIFKRTQRMVKQVTPFQTTKNALDKLVKLLRIRESDRLLFKVHVIHMFFEKPQTPIIVLIGEHGSIKTTITKAVKKLVDPSSSNTGSLPTHYEDIPNNFSNSYLAVFDNISGFKDAVSDMFCRAITGEELSRRKLYTDTDEIIFTYKGKIIINGIAPDLHNPDLNDRTIYYQTLPIPEGEKISDSDFEDLFNKLHSSVLHEIFTAISKTLKTYDTIGRKVKPTSRMADFEKYGETISQALGYSPNEFLQSYRDKRESSAFEGIDNYPVFELIRSLMDNREKYEGGISNFYNILLEMAESAGVNIKRKEFNFPRSVNLFSSQLKKLIPTFRKLGLEIAIEIYSKNDKKYSKNTSVIYIEKVKVVHLVKQKHLTSPTSPTPIREGNKDGKDGKPLLPYSIGEAKSFMCKTHNAGPFNINEKTKSGGLILDFHEDRGCKLEFIE